MNRTHRPASLGWAMVLLAAATMTLAGCGRKGGLDLPRADALPAPAAVVEVDEDAHRAGSNDLFAPTRGADSAPKAEKGGKKAFILDPLLN